MSTTEPSTTFLLGAARSGTSLLYKALCLHRDAAYFNNYSRRLPSHPSVSVTNRFARVTPSWRRRIWFRGDSNAYVYGEQRPLLDRLYPMPVEGEPVFRECGFDEQMATTTPSPAQQRALRRAVIGTMRFGGGRCFINKRIANSRRVPLLASTFPTARFIDLTRDGRAVALSLSRVDWWDDSVVWWYGGTPKRWREEGGDPWELCARNWLEEVTVIDGALDGLDPQRVLRITYEELVADPHGVLRRVAGFAGLRDDPRWLEEVRGLRFGNRNELWRTHLPPQALETIQAVQRGELVRRGYD